MSSETGSNIRLKQGDHACHLHRDFAEQKHVLLEFFRRGLDAGENCLYITGDMPVDEWYFELQAYGIDVQRERERGALHVIDRDEWRSLDGFNTIVQARKTLSLIERFTGSRGLRLATDGAWALRPALPVDQLCHWEAAANLLYEGQRVQAICQYSLQEHEPTGIFAALRTHPFVFLEGQRRRNPYFEAPVILEYEPLLNESCIDAGRLQAMLARLRDGV